MATEYGIAVTIDSSGSQAGAAEYHRSLEQVIKSSEEALRSTAALSKELKKLGSGAAREAKAMGSGMQSAAQEMRKATQQITSDATKMVRAVEAGGVKASQALNAAGGGMKNLSSQTRSTTASVTQDMRKSTQSVDAFANTADARFKAIARRGIEYAESMKQGSLSDRYLAESAREAALGIDTKAEAMKQSGTEAERMAERVARIREEEERVSAATREAARQAKIRSVGLQELLGKIDPTVAKLEQLAALEGRLENALDLGMIKPEVFDQYQAKLDTTRAATLGMGKAQDVASAAIGKLSLNTVEAQQSIMSLARAMATGSWGMATSSITSLTARTGVMSSMFSMAGLAIAGVVGTLALFTIAAVKGYLETRKLEGVMIGLGGAFGVTTGQILDARNEIGRATGDYKGATEAINQLMLSGKVAGEELLRMAGFATSMAQLTGQSVSTVTSEIMSLADGGSDALVKLNDKYKFLTFETWKTIEAVREQKGETEALKLTMIELEKVHSDRTAKMQSQAGILENAWKGVTREFKNAWQALKDWGREDDQYQLRRAEQALETQRTRWRNAGVADPDSKRSVQNAMAEVAQIKERIANSLTQAALDEAEAQRNRDLIAISKERREEAEKAKENIEDMVTALSRQATLEKEIASINSMFNRLDENDPRHFDGSREKLITEATRRVNEQFDNMAQKANTAQDELQKLGEAGVQMMKNLNPMVHATAEFEGNLEQLEKLLGLSETTLQSFGLSHDVVREAIVRLREEFEETRKELDPLAVKYRDVIEEMRSLAEGYRPVGVANAKFMKQMKQVNEMLAMSDEELARLGVTRESLIQGTNDLTRSLQETTQSFFDQTDAARRNANEADPWAKAWENAVGRVDKLFVDVWRSAFDGFKGFKDQVVGTFKDMLAEMANAATTRAITGWFSKFLGGAGNSTVGGNLAIQAGRGVIGGMGGLMVPNGAGGTILSTQTAIGAGTATGNAMTGSNQAMTLVPTSMMGKLMSTYGAQAAHYSSMAAPYVAGAAGVAGGYYGLTQRGEKTGDLGSLAAGASYAALGYAGATMAMGAMSAGLGAAGAGAGAAAAGSAAAGGAMGAAAAVPVVGWVLAALAAIDMISGGKLFGTRHVPDATETSFNIGASGGNATQTLTEVRQKALFGGRSWRTRDIEASEEAQQASKDLFNAVKNVMTEAADTLNVNVPPVINGAIKTLVDLDKKGRVRGTTYQVTAGGVTRDIEEPEEGARWLVAEAIFSVIKTAFPKADAIRKAWAPSLEALEEGVQVLMGLLSAIRADPIKDAQRAWQDEQSSGLEMYRRQREEYSQLLTTFDGSIESIERLAQATGALKNAQFELAMAYHQLSEYGRTMFQSTAQNIRESLMNEEELYDLRQSQIQTLMGQMQQETDPGRLRAMADEINRLTTDAYNILEEDQRLELASGFLSFLDEADALLQERIGKGLDDLGEDSDSVTAEAMERLNEYADRFQQSTDRFSDAVDRFVGGIGGGGGGGGGNNRISHDGAREFVMIR